MRIAVYPGSFDPITNGHLDVVRRAAARLRPGRRRASSRNPRKSPLLDADSGSPSSARRSPTTPALARRSSTSQTFDGLTVDFCHRVGAAFLVRGLRAIADFEAELQLAHNNHQLAPDVDTVFFMTSLEHCYVSSSLVKEIALFGGDVVGDAAGGRAVDALRGRACRPGSGRGPRAIIGPPPRRGDDARTEAVPWTSSSSSSGSSR